jgi:hypothetical protein
MLDGWRFLRGRGNGVTISRRLAIGYEDGEVEIRDLQYLFRYAVGHAEYELRLFHDAGESFDRSNEVLAWSRGIISGPAGVSKQRPWLRSTSA